MTLAEQLREIADRLEAAEQAHADARMDLLGLTSDSWPDSASVPVADGAGAAGGGGTATAPAAPTQPGSGRGENPPATGRPTPAPSVACPECGQLVDPRGLGTHRRHMHGHRVAAKAPVTCPECGEVLAQRKNLWRHRRLHRAADPAAEPVAPIELVLRKGVSGLLTCPECRKQLKRQGYAPHMSRIHQVRLAAASRATPGQRLAARDKGRGNGAPLRKGTEAWICDRCDATFSSREALAVHRTSHAEQPRGQPVGSPARAYSVGGGE